MNQTNWIRLSEYEMYTWTNLLSSVIATLFHSSFVRKRYFTAKILNMHTNSVGLVCMLIYAELCIEPPVEHLSCSFFETYCVHLRCIVNFEQF